MQRPLGQVWQAMLETGVTVLVLDKMVTYLLLRPSLPAYVFGLALGAFELKTAQLGAPHVVSLDATTARPPPTSRPSPPCTLRPARALS